MSPPKSRLYLSACCAARQLCLSVGVSVAGRLAGGNANASPARGCQFVVSRRRRRRRRWQSELRADHFYFYCCRRLQEVSDKLARAPPTTLTGARIVLLAPQKAASEPREGGSPFGPGHPSLRAFQTAEIAFGEALARRGFLCRRRRQARQLIELANHRKVSKAAERASRSAARAISFFWLTWPRARARSPSDVYLLAPSACCRRRRRRSLLSPSRLLFLGPQKVVVGARRSPFSVSWAQSSASRTRRPRATSARARDIRREHNDNKTASFLLLPERAPRGFAAAAAVSCCRCWLTKRRRIETKRNREFTRKKFPFVRPLFIATLASASERPDAFAGAS